MKPQRGEIMFEQVTHPFPPVYDGECTALILGTIPSPVSRENAFYYSHPRNRFWQVLSAVFDVSLPYLLEDKKELVLDNHIALWDVLASCEIDGADDESIRNPIANDFSGLLSETKIERVFTTGEKAHKLYGKLCRKQTRIDAIPLPSTSPANQRISLNELINAYMALRTGTQIT
jgi:hypoxanthine-DNA glycosylase